jgi:hypothetical protein
MAELLAELNNLAKQLEGLSAVEIPREWVTETFRELARRYGGDSPPPRTRKRSGPVPTKALNVARALVRGRKEGRTVEQIANELAVTERYVLKAYATHRRQAERLELLESWDRLHETNRRVRGRILTARQLKVRSR